MLNILCPLCGGHLYEGEVCRSCFAPAELIESIATREKPPKFVGVLGPSGVGKTVYLGMLLDLLSRGVGGLSGMARSPFSLAVHRSLILSLALTHTPEEVQFYCLDFGGGGIVSVSGLPHVLKGMFNQRRPDRLTVRGHWRGIPLSGDPLDAFPSGHAMHVGALASAGKRG